MITDKPVVGVVSIADARKDVDMLTEAREYINKNHIKLIQFLSEQGFEIIDPMSEIYRKTEKSLYAASSTAHIDFCVKELLRKDVQCLVIGCWRWIQPVLGVELVKRLNIPVALFTLDDPNWTGVGAISGVGGSLWEVAPNRTAITHLRIRGDKKKLISWIKGVSAYRRMLRKKLLLWGGWYCLGMDHLQDDMSKLKSFFIQDILNEGEYFLIKRAEEFLKAGKEIKKFIDWLESNGTKVIYDKKMATYESLAKQIALYLAAEQRLKELEEENIAGVSVLCHPELSNEYGVTGCFIPAFLAFGENHCGPKRIIPTTCEGDIKNLLTGVLLNQLVPEVPPMFGDLRDVSVNGGKTYPGIANCGAASVYYAGNSNSAKKTLPEVTIRGQCIGKSGGAVGYVTKGKDATVSNLIRINGKHFMQIGIAKIINVDKKVIEKRNWGRMWSYVVFDLGVDINEFLTICGSNHYSLIHGIHDQEITYACIEAGIPIMRIDSKQSIDKALNEIRYR